MKQVTMVMLLSLLVTSGCDPRYGFIESQFSLSPESRLPNWFEKPAEFRRKDYEAQVTFYTFDKAKIVITRLPNKEIVSSKVGKSKWHPETENRYEYGKGVDYPTYTIITVNGVAEVFEKRKDGPILFITDDPRLTSIIASPDKGKTSKNIE